MLDDAMESSVPAAMPAAPGASARRPPFDSLPLLYKVPPSSFPDGTRESGPGLIYILPLSLNVFAFIGFTVFVHSTLLIFFDSPTSQPRAMRLA